MTSVTHFIECPTHCDVYLNISLFHHYHLHHKHDEYCSNIYHCHYWWHTSKGILRKFCVGSLLKMLRLCIHSNDWCDSTYMYNERYQFSENLIWGYGGAKSKYLKILSQCQFWNFTFTYFEIFNTYSVSCLKDLT